MPRDFVPLVPARFRGSTPGAVAATPGETAGKAAVSPVAGVAVATSGPAAFAPLRAVTPAESVPCPTAGEPVITLQKDGDRITGIRIECTCGQVVELACVY